MATITGRKVRADAKLEHLNEAQRERLHFLFEENWSYSEVVRLVREQLGVSVSRSTVSAYYRRHILPEQQQDDVEVAAAFAALPTADFDAATLQRAKALLWSALASINPDVELAAKLSGIIDKTERRALALRKLALEERKVAVREKRAVAAERRSGSRRETTEAEVGTTKHTKRHERADRSAEVIGRDEGAEGAAKALSCEGRSEGAVAANLACERENLPRFSGYSEVMRAEEGAEVARESRESARMERQDGDPRKATEESEESAKVVGRDEGAEGRVAAGLSYARASGALNSGRLGEPASPSEHGADAALVAEIGRNLDEYEARLQEIGEGADAAERGAEIARAVYADLVRFTSRPGYTGRKLTPETLL